ncbi:MAG: NAD(P)-dependent alcohol dehydrogenase [Planctomycetota bacterium]|jgi:NADPH:quinone reductase-like Zn-dependent oxidoreductase
MKALTYERYGSPDVLQLREIDKPVVGDGDVLVRVRAASVNPADWHFLRGRPYVMRLISGLRRPKTHGLGFDLAGEVEAVGPDVTRFRPGDEVYGQVEPAATFAEYVRVKQDRVARKPANLTFEQAAAVPLAGLTALQGLRDKGRIGAGQKVLVNGASGGVGTFAVQVAKSFGAEVTGVCSARNVELVRSIGADHVIDYTREDFTRGDRRYDVMLDNVGNHSLLECRRVLVPGAIYVSNGGPDGRWLQPLLFLAKTLLQAMFVSQKVASYVENPNTADLEAMRELIEAGKVTPVIDRQYALSEVPEAIRYLEEGHARGKVVIDVAPSG